MANTHIIKNILDCTRHRKDQCVLCSVRHLCDGIKQNDCDIFEIAEYNDLVTTRKHLLEEKVELALQKTNSEEKNVIAEIRKQTKETIELIKEKHVVLNNEIEANPRLRFNYC